MEEAWSPDAKTLSDAALATATQPGGMGAGPRLALEEVYDTFRVLNLAGMGITTVSLYHNGRPTSLTCFGLETFRFRVSGIEFRVSCSGFVFVFWILCFGFGFRVRDSEFGLFYGFGFRNSVLGLENSGFGFLFLAFRFGFGGFSLGLQVI